MKRKEKTSVILGVFNVIGKARFGDMSSEDKIKLWKIARVLKPIASKFDEDSKDAATRFKEGFDNFDERLQNAQQYEMAMKNANFDASTLKMGAAEYQEFIKEFKEYDKVVSDAVKEFGEKEVEVDIDPISEDAFATLIAANDGWTVEQTIEIGNFIL